MRRVPESVAEIIGQVFGERGRQWLADLPDVIDDRCAAWELEIVGESFSGGTHSYVAPVRRADGTTAVLKLPVVDDENIAEATALRLYDGDGAVQLYAFDRDSGAMLLEHAVPGQPLVYQPPEGPALEGRPENADRVSVGCEILRDLWRPAPDTGDLPSLPRATDVVAAWHNDLRAETGGVVPSSLVALAVELCEELATPDGPEGVVNRDTHLGNIVSATRMPWLLIDPKPLLGERAFDAGYLINKLLQAQPECGIAREVVARIAEGLGVAPARARAWAFLRAVENASPMNDEDQTEDVQRQMAVAVALS